jgi:hypothetical protein
LLFLLIHPSRNFFIAYQCIRVMHRVLGACPDCDYTILGAVGIEILVILVFRTQNIRNTNLVKQLEECADFELKCLCQCGKLFKLD